MTYQEETLTLGLMDNRFKTTPLFFGKLPNVSQITAEYLRSQGVRDQDYIKQLFTS